MAKDKRILILAQRTKWGHLQCRDFLKDIGNFSMALSEIFQQSVSRTDFNLAKASLRAAQADQADLVGVEASEITPEVLNQLFS